MFEQIQATAKYIKEQINDFIPQYGIVLGTGLGGLAQEIDVNYSLAYDTLPSFPISTVETHSGKLLFGTLAGKRVVAMQGRFHYYEGYSMEEVVFPIRVMKLLGIEKLFVSNASGGINPTFKVADSLWLIDK